MSKYRSYQSEDELRYDGRNRYLNSRRFNSKNKYSFIKYINDIYFGKGIIIESNEGLKYLVPEDTKRHFRRRC